MATKQWLADNPKVLGYLPKTVHDQLQEFKAEQGVSVSRALTMILESYFELESFKPSTDTCTDKRLSNLEQQVAAIKVTVDQLSKQTSPIEDVVTVEEIPVEEPSSPTNTSQSRILRFNKSAIIPANSPLSSEKKESTNKSQSTFTTRSQPNSSSEEPPIYKTVRIPRSQSVESEEQVEKDSQTAGSDIEITSSQAQEPSTDNSSTSLSKSKLQLGGRKIQNFFKGFSPPSLKPSDQNQD